MPDYSNGKVYEFTDKEGKVLYIGSTSVGLEKRLMCHKSDCKSNRQHRKLYEYIGNIGWGAVDMKLLESYSCSSKKELLEREQHWIDKLKPTLNIATAFPTYDVKLKQAVKHGKAQHCWRCNLDLIDSDDYTRHKFKVHWEQSWIDAYMKKNPKFKP